MGQRCADNSSSLSWSPIRGNEHGKPNERRQLGTGSNNERNHPPAAPVAIVKPLDRSGRVNHSKTSVIGMMTTCGKSPTLSAVSASGSKDAEMPTRLIETGPVAMPKTALTEISVRINPAKAR
jgi:hypothetical protein